MQNKVFAIIVPLLCVMSLLLLLAVPAPAKAAPFTDSGTIYYNDHKEIFVGSFTSTHEVSFEVTTNSTVDVYLLTSDQNNNYPTSFTPTKAVENTKIASFKITPNTGTSYYLVIDNLDNSRSTDAVPTGVVTFNAKYPNPTDTLTDNVETFANTCLIGAIVVVLILTFSPIKTQVVL